MNETEKQETPLQRRLNGLGKTLGIAALAICAVIFIIGILLFLSCQGIFDYSVIEKLIVPVVFIVIGFCIMGNALGFKRDKKEKIESFHAEGVKDYSAAFGGQTIVYSENEVFEGATINAIFGGVDLDLRSCIINSDVVIDCTTIFGGADIYIPSDVNVKITSTPIFGGVSNSKRKNNFVESAPTVYINAVCMFGGVDVK